MSGSVRGVRSNAHSYRDWGEGLGNDLSYPANDRYARISTVDQDLAIQKAWLSAARCKIIRT